VGKPAWGTPGLGQRIGAPRRRSILINALFRRLWLAQAISVFGDYLAMFAVQALVVFRLHGSAAQVGAVLLISLVPAIAIGPFAGVFADRWDPRRTMILSDASRAILVLLLALVPTHGERSALVELCAICFAISCVSAFFIPAQGVIIPAVVDRTELLAASAAMQQTWQWARIVSPGVAAAILARFSENACFAADAASFIVSALLVSTISFNIPRTSNISCTPRPQPSGEHPASRVLRDMHAGAAFLFQHAELSGATLAMVAGTFATGCFSSLAGVYVRDVLHAGMPVYGALGSLIAVGMLAGSLFVGRLTQRGTRETPREQMIASGMGLIGLCIFALAALPSVFTALLGAAGIGLGASGALVTANAVLRERTPADLRGRVVSVCVATMSAAQAAAIFLAGNGAAWIGVRGVFALAAVMLLAQPAYRYFRRGTIPSAPAACFQNPR
jgi:MFS family permease